MAYAPSLKHCTDDLQLTDVLTLNYCRPLMKHVISVHYQVTQDLPELSFKLCHALEPGDWAYIRVHQRKNYGREHTSYTALPSLPSKGK